MQALMTTAAMKKSKKEKEDKLCKLEAEALEISRQWFSLPSIDKASEPPGVGLANRPIFVPGPVLMYAICS